MACTHGANCKVAIDGLDFGFARFVPNQVVKQVTDGAQDTITGNLDLEGTRIAEGILLANFSILIEPTWEEILLLLPLLGLEGSGSAYEIEDDPPEMDVLVDYHQSDSFRVHSFGTAKIGGFEWFGQKGASPCKLMMHFFAKTWDNTSAWSGVTTITPDAPIPFCFGFLTDNGSQMQFDRFKLAVNRHMYTEHNNSINPTDQCPRWTEIALGTSYPYTSGTNVAPHDAALSAPAVARSLVLSHVVGAKSLALTMATGFLVAQGIPILGKENVRYNAHYRVMGYTDPDTEEYTPSLSASIVVP